MENMQRMEREDQGDTNVHVRVTETVSRGGGKNCERRVPEAKAGERLRKAVFSRVSNADELSRRRKMEQGHWTWALVTVTTWVSAVGVEVEGGLQS